jgi:hypothetical protein
MQSVLTINGLAAPAEFPVSEYEAIYSRVGARFSQHDFYENFSAGWNAVAYRFSGCVDEGHAFNSLLEQHGSTPAPVDRYVQERLLFGFFTNGYSVFEALFYSQYAIGAFLDTRFAFESAKDQQQVTPRRTSELFRQVFPKDPISTAHSDLFLDRHYQEWREIRNVLAHRSAPGRRMYLGLGLDDAPATEWKLNNVPIDSNLVPSKIEALSRLLRTSLIATAEFVVRRL